MTGEFMMKDDFDRIARLKAERDAAVHNEAEIRKHLVCRIEAADRANAEVERLRARAERAERERDAYLAMLTPENSGGLWYAATGRMDPFVGWTAMELDGPWRDRANAVAAVRKAAGLETPP